jgi:hypothetical protein
METHSSMQKHFHPKNFINLKRKRKRPLLFQPQNTKCLKNLIYFVVSFVTFSLESFSLFVTLNPTGINTYPQMCGRHGWTPARPALLPTYPPPNESTLYIMISKYGRSLKFLFIFSLALHRPKTVGYRIH